MSGPVAAADVSAAPEPSAPGDPAPRRDALGGPPPGGASGVETWESRDAQVGGVRVRRALPRRQRRSVGPWCFVDHMDPEADQARGMGIGPHPHIGLHTVTWLLDGEAVHTDSLGSEQLIRPGEVNLMTAGTGVAHAEESTRTGATLRGVQLWVAQPESTRHGPAAFEHHAQLPIVDVASCRATVLVGTLGGMASPARADWPTLGAELRASAGAFTLPLEPDFEHALVVLDGTGELQGTTLRTGHTAYLAPGREELELAVAGGLRALLLGGRPFSEPLLMWWNFVARTPDEIDAATSDWETDGGRFGSVRSGLQRMPAPRPPWSSAAQT